MQTVLFVDIVICTDWGFVLLQYAIFIEKYRLSYIYLPQYLAKRAIFIEWNKISRFYL